MNEEQVRRMIQEEMALLFGGPTSDLIISKRMKVLDGRNIQVGVTTGTKIGTGTTQKLGFFGTAPAVQQTSGENLTNNVASGGTDGTIANFTDLTTYANDAAAIRNNIYQLSRKLKQVNDGLRTFGLFT